VREIKHPTACSRASRHYHFNGRNPIFEDVSFVEDQGSIILPYHYSIVVRFRPAGSWIVVGVAPRNRAKNHDTLNRAINYNFVAFKHSCKRAFHGNAPTISRVIVAESYFRASLHSDQRLVAEPTMGVAED
jgi:hypothetical protein